MADLDNINAHFSIQVLIGVILICARARAGGAKSFGNSLVNSRPFSARSTSATVSRACGYGCNFPLSELQSLICRIQLHRLPDWAAASTSNALILAEALCDFPAVRVPLPPVGIEHAWYKFYTF